MKTIIIKNYKYFSTVVIMLFFLLYCDDNKSKNERIIHNNVSKLKSLQTSAELNKKDVVLANSSRLNEIRESIHLLELSNKILNDSLIFYTSKLTDLDIRINELTKEKSYLSDTDQRTKSKITPNISNLESVINSLKISIYNEEKNFNKIAKRKEVILKKNESLKSELEFKQKELNELYSTTDARNKTEEVNKKIKKINNEILLNKNLLLEEYLNEKLSDSKISNLDDQITTKQKLFKTEYEKSSGINDYLESANEDLVYTLNNLEIKKSELSQKWKFFKNEKENVLLELQNLQVDNSQLLNPSKASIQINSFESNKELTSANHNTKQKEELTETQEIIEESTKTTESSWSYVYWYVLLVILILVGLHWLGKKNKKHNSFKDLGE